MSLSSNFHLIILFDLLFVLFSPYINNLGVLFSILFPLMIGQENQKQKSETMGT